MPDLIVNVDHIATIRQARLAHEPDPVHAAHHAELGGAHGIIVHLREDRRHIQDRDVRLLTQTLGTKLHLEMAATREMQDIALQAKPHIVCLVPEKRQELTTEGGMNLLGRETELQEYLQPLHQADITSSLFIDPDPDQIKAAAEIEAEYIELHTGHFADAETRAGRDRELDRIKEGLALAHNLGLKVNLGHGLTYANIHAFAHMPGVSEFSIGHSIVARASLVGMERAVRDMLDIIRGFC
ncbi:pyridoxine 5'-phosphate synthase [Desulfovermiculus halophilus]|jgi:pyridoxine 5-phosphate synthase|uniref:pyridoxine 5'-phosphate synthase n=1 Tax=Desulfovermiculus halophilus TaxID=339722 RepID=UPI000480A9E1|nr:pyridoxine 5'-phosphate synthase [Desulfovermiculus halophilus]